MAEPVPAFGDQLLGMASRFALRGLPDGQVQLECHLSSVLVIKTFQYEHLSEVLDEMMRHILTHFPPDATVVSEADVLPHPNPLFN